MKGFSHRFLCLKNITGDVLQGPVLWYIKYIMPKQILLLPPTKQKCVCIPLYKTNCINTCKSYLTEKNISDQTTQCKSKYISCLH